MLRCTRCEVVHRREREPTRSLSICAPDGLVHQIFYCDDCYLEFFTSGFPHSRGYVILTEEVMPGVMK